MKKTTFKNILYAAAFPFYSLFSRRMGFTVFWPSKGTWRAFTRGKVFNVKEPRVWCLEYFRRFVPSSGDLVFDVGGELGYETQQFAEMVGVDGRVVVFECFPSHVALLKESCKASNNVIIVDKACWNQTTTLEFFSGHTPGSNTAVTDAAGQRGQQLANIAGKKFIVEADLLDNFWKEFAGGRSVDFLKMDIEGAEYEALEGASHLLKNTRKVVVAAYHIRGGVRTADRVAAVLRESGFKVEIGDNHHVYAHRT